MAFTNSELQTLADQALLMLENQVFTQAMATLQQDAIKALTHADPTDVSRIASLQAKAIAVSDLKQELKNAIIAAPKAMKTVI